MANIGTLELTIDSSKAIEMIEKLLERKRNELEIEFIDNLISLFNGYIQTMPQHKEFYGAVIEHLQCIKHRLIYSKETLQ